MPWSSQRSAGNVFGTSRTLWNAILYSGLFLLLSACGEGQAQFSTVDIKRAEWRGEKVLVGGSWAKGISTPPNCRMLEGRDGPISTYFGPDARVSLDNNTFSKEFVLIEAVREDSPGKKDGYYVRCTVGLDSGKSSDDTMKVENTS